MSNIVVDKNGTKHRYENDKLHCADGPAVTYVNGTQMWYEDGKRHRSDGPSIVYPDGSEMWHKDGVLHRKDGPAVKYPDGTYEWFLHDKKCTLDEWCKQTKKTPLETVYLRLKYE